MSNRSGSGEPGIGSAGGGSETEASQAETEPDVLDGAPQGLVPLGGSATDREAGDRGGLASRRISAVLASAVSRKSRWQGQKITPEIQELIHRMSKEDPTWGAPLLTLPICMT